MKAYTGKSSKKERESVREMATELFGKRGAKKYLKEHKRDLRQKQGAAVMMYGLQNLAFKS